MQACRAPADDRFYGIAYRLVLEQPADVNGFGQKLDGTKLPGGVFMVCFARPEFAKSLEFWKRGAQI